MTLEITYCRLQYVYLFISISRKYAVSSSYSLGRKNQSKYKYLIFNFLYFLPKRTRGYPEIFRWSGHLSGEVSVRGSRGELLYTKNDRAFPIDPPPRPPPAPPCPSNHLHTGTPPTPCDTPQRLGCGSSVDGFATTDRLSSKKNKNHKTQFVFTCATTFAPQICKIGPRLGTFQ